MIRSVLIDQYAENLDYAKRLTHGLGEADSVDQPAPGVNHPRWVIGHVACTADRVTAHSALGLNLRFDDEYVSLFGGKSKPRPDASAYPPMDDLFDRLTERHETIVEAVRAADGSLLEQPMRPDVSEGLRQRFPTVGHALVYTMVAHEQMHLGQVSAWRCIRGLPAV